MKTCRICNETKPSDQMRPNENLCKQCRNKIDLSISYKTKAKQFAQDISIKHNLNKKQNKLVFTYIRNQYKNLRNKDCQEIKELLIGDVYRWFICKGIDLNEVEGFKSWIGI
jgi:hypothetical protein